MSLFKLKVSTDPRERTIELGVKIAASTLSISLVSIDDFTVHLEADGNPAEEVLTKKLIPLIDSLTPLIPAKIQRSVKEMTKKRFQRDLGSQLGYDLAVNGVKVRVKAEALKISTYKDMLMAAGTIKVA